MTRHSPEHSPDRRVPSEARPAPRGQRSASEPRQRSTPTSGQRGPSAAGQRTPRPAASRQRRGPTAPQGNSLAGPLAEQDLLDAAPEDGLVDLAAVDAVIGHLPPSPFPMDDGPATDEIPAVPAIRHVPEEDSVPPRLRARQHRSRRRGEVQVALAPSLEADDRDARLAMLAYLTVPFFGFFVPLAVYLTALRGSVWLRTHAAQALNVWLTGLLYTLSAVIMGVMLAFDSVAVAVSVVGPILVLLWVVMLVFLVRAATRASQGEEYRFPRWLCSRVAS